MFLGPVDTGTSAFVVLYCSATENPGQMILFYFILLSLSQ